jgi:hypothetical protein
MGDQTNKLYDFTNVPNVQFIANPITSPEIKVDSFEVNLGLLNLISKDQFGGSASEDASMHLHDFCAIINSMLDSAVGGAFMTKTINEAKAILENMPQNFGQWHTERAPSSIRKINSVEEVDSLTTKVDAIYSYISKQNVDNVPLQDLVENNFENINSNYIINFGNNAYNKNYNN